MAAATRRSVGVDDHVAELARHATVAGEQGSIENQPRADPVREHQVDDVGGAPAGADRAPRRARRGWRRCRHARELPSRAAQLGAERDVASSRGGSRRPPGRRCRAGPAPRSRRRRRATVDVAPQAVAASATATSIARIGSLSTSSSWRVSAMIVPARSASATRTELWPKSIPPTAPSPGRSPAATSGGPARPATRRPRRGSLGDESLGLQLADQPGDRGARQRVSRTTSPRSAGPARHRQSTTTSPCAHRTPSSTSITSWSRCSLP